MFIRQDEWQKVAAILKHSSSVSCSADRVCSSSWMNITIALCRLDMSEAPCPQIRRDRDNTGFSRTENLSWKVCLLLFLSFGSVSCRLWTKWNRGSHFFITPYHWEAMCWNSFVVWGTVCSYGIAVAVTSLHWVISDSPLSAACLEAMQMTPVLNHFLKWVSW